MGKRLICDLHDEIAELCYKQDELVSEGKSGTKIFDKNFRKIIRLLEEAKKAGQAMEDRMTVSRESLVVYVEEMGFDVKRRKRKNS